nr:peroxide stress protein YaaA [Saccharopolyspora sp. HNM0983]
MVLLPPSETKAAGGSGPALDLDSLSYPDLNPTRRKLLEALSTLADDVPASLDALGLSERQVDEVARNAELWDAPTAPALERYTGVLYDALDVGSLDPGQRERADRRLAVASALFGMVRGGDRIPGYRLSGGSSLPGVGSLRSTWRPVLEPVLAEGDDLLLDMRSGAYAALARTPHAIGVRVLSEDPSGKRKVISHHNKAHKGGLARALARSPAEPESAADVIEVAEQAGLHVEREGEHGLCVVVRT